MKWVARM